MIHLPGAELLVCMASFVANRSARGAGGKERVLIANRGEIARRVARSCQQLGLDPVIVFTQPDALSLHVLEAKLKVCLGDSTREYTNAAKLVEVAVSQGCAPCCSPHMLAQSPCHAGLHMHAQLFEGCT